MASEAVEIVSMANIQLMPLHQELLSPSLAAAFDIMQPETFAAATAGLPAPHADPKSAFAAPASRSLLASGGQNSWFTMAETLHRQQMEMRQRHLAQQGLSDQREAFSPSATAPETSPLSAAVGTAPAANPFSAMAAVGLAYNPYTGFSPVLTAGVQPYFPHNPFTAALPPFLPPAAVPGTLVAGVALCLGASTPDGSSPSGALPHPHFGHALPAQHGRPPQQGSGVELWAPVPQPQALAGQSQAQAPLVLLMSKKPRVAWTPHLHKRFVKAVTELGVDTAVPKQIMLAMNVDGLTRENVASHLQKFRLKPDKD